MTSAPTRRPTRDEFPELHGRYIALVPEGEIVAALRRQLDEAEAEFAAIPEDLHGHRYAPEKWSIADVLGHVADGERMFSYRAMQFGRGMVDGALPDFDQDICAAHAGAARRSLASLTREFAALRRANIEMAGNFSDADLDRRGVASGAAVSVRALVFMLFGHVAHHRQVLRERYL